MKIIAGLGNPGVKYQNNRHNVGFMAADEIVRRHAVSANWQKKFSAELCVVTLGDEKAIIIKPQTFMNNSGQAIGEALRFHKLTVADLIVIYDELDLAPGKLRIKTGGGHGGHNGLKSIDAHCGKDYVRVRIGIGHPGHKDRVHGHVLGDFAKADSAWLEPLLETIGREAPMLAKGDHSGFMNKAALAVQATAPEADTQKPPPKAKSHIHQARQSGSKPEPSGPMADMLKKLLGR